MSSETYNRPRWKRWGKTMRALLACWAMFQLNRNALSRYREDGIRQLSYDLKNRLIKQLYLSGRCERVTVQEQTLNCYSCGGSGLWHGIEVCWKCEGTGIYARHLLYLFEFRVAWRRFAWHQPVRLVDWDVKLSVEKVGKFDASKDPVHISDEHALALCSVVAAYLQSVGVETRALKVAGELDLLPAIGNWLWEDSRGWLARQQLRLLSAAEHWRLIGHTCQCPCACDERVRTRDGICSLCRNGRHLHEVGY